MGGSVWGRSLLCGSGRTYDPAAGDAPFYLNLPELGVIPSGACGLSLRQLARLGGMVRRPAQNIAGEHENGASNGLFDDRIELRTCRRKPSPLAESFRSLLISILFSGENGSRPKVLVLTSAGPGEGKSTVVSNLGMRSLRSAKGLLIDADLRQPRLQDIFSLPNGPD